MDGTTSPSLCLFNSYSTPPSCVLFLPLSFFFFPTNTIFHFLPTSVPASCGPSALLFYGFSSVSPTPAPHPLVLNGGFRTPQWSEERPFLHRHSLSTHLPEPPALLYLSLSSLFTFSYQPAFFFISIPPHTNSHSSHILRCTLTTDFSSFITYSHFSLSLLCFLWPLLCASLLYACFH